MAYLEHWVNCWWLEEITHKDSYITRSVYTKLSNFMEYIYKILWNSIIEDKFYQQYQGRYLWKSDVGSRKIKLVDNCGHTGAQEEEMGIFKAGVKWGGSYDQRLRNRRGVDSLNMIKAIIAEAWSKREWFVNWFLITSASQQHNEKMREQRRYNSHHWRCKLWRENWQTCDVTVETLSCFQADLTQLAHGFL